MVLYQIVREIPPRPDYKAARLPVFTRIMLFLMRCRERLHIIHSTKNIEWSEGISTFLSFCFFMPLAFNPNYFVTSQVLVELSRSISQTNCAYVFGIYMFMQLIGLICGAEPPKHPTTALTVKWLYYRAAVMVSGSVLWFVATGLFTFPYFPDLRQYNLTVAGFAASGALYLACRGMHDLVERINDIQIAEGTAPGQALTALFQTIVEKRKSG